MQSHPRLFLDADVSMHALQRALQTLGHDVLRTPNEWMALDAGEKRQLLEASARGRCFLTHNISDFMHLARTCPDHGGIVLAHQTGWTPTGQERVDCNAEQDVDRDRRIRLAGPGALAHRLAIVRGLFFSNRRNQQSDRVTIQTPSPNTEEVTCLRCKFGIDNSARRIDNECMA